MECKRGSRGAASHARYLAGFLNRTAALAPKQFTMSRGVCGPALELLNANRLLGTGIISGRRAGNLNNDLDGSRTSIANRHTGQKRRYSITLSARASSDAGIVTPSV